MTISYVPRAGQQIIVGGITVPAVGLETEDPSGIPILDAFVGPQLRKYVDGQEVTDLVVSEPSLSVMQHIRGEADPMPRNVRHTFQFTEDTSDVYLDYGVMGKVGPINSGMDSEQLGAIFDSFFGSPNYSFGWSSTGDLGFGSFDYTLGGSLAGKTLVFPSILDASDDPSEAVVGSEDSTGYPGLDYPLGTLYSWYDAEDDEVNLYYRSSPTEWREVETSSPG